ncbi:MAG: hypothetical protein HZC55_17910 [Verrucomicrobia bacterium]|nr:hypothetical protein [Verrucomicrobiota bacterium]
MSPLPTRRQFLGGVTALAALGGSKVTSAASARPVFSAQGNEFTFDTGALRGTLRGKGQSKGLIPVVDVASGKPVARSYGWFSPYRLLDDTHRYGDAAWSWPSTARLLPNGAVEVNWPAHEQLPVEIAAVYRWSAPNVLDFPIRVTARRPVRRFEVFLASYFEGFPDTVVPVGPAREFVGAPRSAGDWQMFPRDEAAVSLIKDGRWKHAPSPVDWTIRPSHALPLAIRRDPSRGQAAVLMTRPEECFAVAIPYDTEVHRSVYFSLFGRDLKEGESVGTWARLWIGPDLTNAAALDLYRAFRENPRTP